jgi:N-acylneuraminate cytidylyltransferase
LQDKLIALNEWLDERGLDRAQVVYVGNDLNDLECMKAVGCAVAVADAHPEVLSAARIVLEGNGGQGAIRELAEMIERRMQGGCANAKSC